MSVDDDRRPSEDSVSFREAVRRYAASKFRGSLLPRPFPGLARFARHEPRNVDSGDREAMMALCRDLAAGLGKSWGRMGSMCSPWQRIPLDAWEALRCLDYATGRFAVDEHEPATFAWNVHVWPNNIPSEEIHEWEPFDIAALGLAFRHGLCTDTAERAVASAIFTGGAGEALVRVDANGELHVDMNEDGELLVHPMPETVRLRRADNLLPYAAPRGRPGDISVTFSRIIPGFDHIWREARAAKTSGDIPFHLYPTLSVHWGDVEAWFEREHRWYVKRNHDLRGDECATDPASSKQYARVVEAIDASQDLLPLRENRGGKKRYADALRRRIPELADIGDLVRVIREVMADRSGEQEVKPES